MLKHITPEPSTVESYLRDLKHDLLGEVPEQKLDEILAETESHLRERVEAFQELGLANPEEEAVRSFVSQPEFAKEMADGAVSDRLAAKVRPWQKWVMTCSALLSVGALWAVGGDPASESLPVLALPALMAIVGALAFVSRRPQTQRIVTTGALSAALAFTYFGLTWVERGDFALPRVEAQLQAANWQNAALGHEPAVADVHLGRWVFSQDKPQVPPRFMRGRRYLIPPRYRFNGHEETTANLAEAKRAWKERGPNWLGWLRSYPARYSDLAQSYKEALKGPSFRADIAGKAAKLSIAFSLLVLLMDWMFARIGEALFWRRRNRKRPKLGSA